MEAVREGRGPELVRFDAGSVKDALDMYVQSALKEEMDDLKAVTYAEEVGRYMYRYNSKTSVEDVSAAIKVCAGFNLGSRCIEDDTQSRQFTHSEVNIITIV